MEWLKLHSNIKLITRDGSRTYAKAITQVSEDILQVGDRWHILHQLFEAVKKTMTGVIPLRWQSFQKEQRSSEDFTGDIIVRKSDVVRLQNEEKRWARIQKVQTLHKQGYPVTVTQRKVHISRGLSMRICVKKKGRTTSGILLTKSIIRSCIHLSGRISQIGK